MEDLQDALQSILSDPEQMARVAALAESLGLKPPNDPDVGAAIGRPHEGKGSETSQVNRMQDEQGGKGSEESVPLFPFTGTDGNNIGQVMNLLSASSGGETKVLSALRPTLGPEGQRRVDRALRAAKLSRVVGVLLTRRRTEHV